MTPVVPMLAAALPSCSQICLTKDATEVLPAGAGDGDHRVRLLAEEARCRQRQRQPRIGDLDDRHRGAGKPGAGCRNDGQRAALGGVGGVGCAIGLRAGQREEQERLALSSRESDETPATALLPTCPFSTGRIPARSLSFIEFQSYG